MPRRLIPFENNRYYHVYNHGLDMRSTFRGKKQYQKAIESIWYYRYLSPSLRLSHLQTLNQEKKGTYIDQLQQEPKQVEVIAYCLMPNHYHLIVKQLANNGISAFMSKVQNSYTRYYNQLAERRGPLFSTQFKAVPLASDDQLINLSRYVHLKPFLKKKVKTMEELAEYPWSSYSEYLGIKPEYLCFTDRSAILGNIGGVQAYRSFVSDIVSYKQQLPDLAEVMLES